MDALALYHRTHAQAVAFDVSHFGKLALLGADRATFLQNFTTNDVVKPGIGSGCETFLTTAQAKVVAWLRVALRPDEIYLTMEPGLAAKVMAHLERYQIAENVQFEDRSETDLLWHICGPQFAQCGKPMAVSVDWSQWQTGLVQINNDEVWIQRCDYLGLPGVFLSSPLAAAPRLLSLLHNHQVPLIPGADPAWEMLRLEAGIPAHGVDFDETNLPQEVNRTEQAISFTKGCYIGQETVARIRAYGHVNKLLVGVKLALNRQSQVVSSSWQGGKLFDQDKEVGIVKTVAYSPRLDSLLAWAMVRRGSNAPETKLQARASAGEEVEAEVIELPLSRAGVSEKQLD